MGAGKSFTAIEFLARSRAGYCRYISQSCCPWNVTFSQALKEPGGAVIGLPDDGGGYASVTVSAAAKGYFTSIDRCGRVAGTNVEGTVFHAFVWDGATITQLPLPAGIPATASTSAIDITTITSGPNAGKGLIVGSVRTDSGALPVRWMIAGCP